MQSCPNEPHTKIIEFLAFIVQYSFIINFDLFMGEFMSSVSGSRELPIETRLLNTVINSSNFTTLSEKGRLGSLVGTVCTMASIVFDYHPTVFFTFTAISGLTWYCCDNIAKNFESQAQQILEHFKESQKEKGQNPIISDLLPPMLAPSLKSRTVTTATLELMKGRLWPLINMALYNGRGQYKALGSFSVFKLGKIVVSTDKKQNEAILKYQRYDKNVRGGYGWDTFARACFGWENLIMAEGEKHVKLVKTLGPLFTQPIVVNRYFNNLKVVTQTTVSDWAKEKDGIFLLNAALEHSCKSVTTCFLGKQAAQSKEIVEAVQNLMGVFWNLAQLNPMAIANQISRKIFGRRIGDFDGYWRSHDVLEDAIKKARTESQETKEDNFINRLLDDKFTPQELIDNMKMLYFAGTETTGSLITTILGHLATKKFEQETLLEELHQANIEKLEDLNHEKLLKLKRLNAVFYESLRLVPPIPAQVRKVQTEFGKYNFFVDHFHRLRDCTVAGLNPEEFNPNRFLYDSPLRGEVDKTFGSGRTPCLGKHFAINETLLLIAATILQGRFELIEGNPSEVIMEAGAHLSTNLKIRFKDN